MSADEIKVECEINKVDVLAWNHYYMQNDTKAKQSIKKLWIIGLPFMFILLIIGIFFSLKGDVIGLSDTERKLFGTFLILWGVLGFLYFLFFRKIMLFIIKRNINKNYKKGQNIVMGIHKYSFSSEGVDDITELTNSKIKWGAMENISETDKHIFIRIHPNAALIIPKRAFADDSTSNKFTEDVKVIFEKSKIIL